MSGGPETEIQKVKDILGQQVREYKDLLQLLQKERQSLIVLDGAAIDELVKKKDTAVLKLRLLEQERLRLVEKVSNHYGASGLLSLQEIAAKTGDEAFGKLRNQLICILQSIAELNEFNRMIIGRSLAVVNGSLEALGKSGPAGGRGKGLAVSLDI